MSIQPTHSLVTDEMNSLPLFRRLVIEDERL